MPHLSASIDQFRIRAHSTNAPVGNVSQENRTPFPAQGEFNPERLLIAVANHQDKQAFGRLFEHFSGRVFALGMKLTRNEQLSRDLVQDAMLALWQKAPLYDVDKGSAETWIFTLVRNRCFDLLRKRKQQPELLGADDIWPLENDAAFSENPASRQDAEVGMRQIQRHYQNLPSSQREVIEEVFFNDLTHQEAAIKLEIPLGTLKSRLRLGLGRLKQLIGAES